MTAIHLISYFFGGLFFANSVPHLVAGTMGRAFQSPFATPSGEGLSSSTVNVVWGFVNVFLAYLLIVHVGVFHLRSATDVLSCGAGGVAISLFAARHFGRFHGGNTPLHP